MRYYTFWSVLDSPSQNIQSYHISLIVAIICLAGFILVKRYTKPHTSSERSIYLWTFGFVFCLAGFLFVCQKFIYEDDSRKRTAKFVNSSDVSIVEGCITNFERKYRKTKYKNVMIESFYVDSVFFTYEDSPFLRLYHFAETNNGVFHNGLPVRITYTKKNLGYGESDNNNILKVEVGAEVNSKQN